MASLDDIDRKILRSLAKNAKHSHRDVAAEVGVSNVTIMNRMKRLEEEGIIRGYTLLLDYERLGCQFQACIEIKVGKNRLEFDRLIATDGSITNVYETSGDHETLMFVRLQSRTELDALLKRLRAMEGVSSIKVKVIMSTLKEEVSGI